MHKEISTKAHAARWQKLAALQQEKQEAKSALIARALVETQKRFDKQQTNLEKAVAKPGRLKDGR